MAKEITPVSEPKARPGSNDWIVPGAVVSMVMVMLIPIPGIILDMLLSVSLSASVLVLIVSMYIERPVQFSVFPSLLLMLTLFRLSLNLASSRRILLHGGEGSSAAGRVIEAFGQFVVGGNYVVGFVIFLALIAIQYLVINHGAVRIAEVTARFTLDALPGKQMAIDADLGAGLIDEQQARSRRERIAHEAEFYGAMDGAARFSQRDALATILITIINIVAGFLIGVFQQGIPFAEALQNYTILTVGDGLVTMVPSLLVSVAGGMVATRASSESSLGSDLGSQLLVRSKPLWVVTGVMLILSLIPGLPKFSFFAVAGFLAWLAMRAKSAAPARQAEQAAARNLKKPEHQDSVPPLDELALEVGYGLVELVDESRGGHLLKRIRALRRHLATQLGFLIPAVHITDDPQLKPREYVLKLRGVELARWVLYQEHLLAVSSEANPEPIEGKDTREPAFNVPAKWIPTQLREQALAAGYAVVDQPSVVATHIAELVKQHAFELLTRHETKRLLDGLAETQPKLVEELVPKLLSLGEVQRVLQQILRENVPVRDLATILETLVDVAPTSKNPIVLVEAVRQALGRTFVRPLLAEDGKLKVIQVDPGIQDRLNQAFDPQSAAGRQPGFEPSILRKVLEGLKKLAGEHLEFTAPVLLCASPARFHLRRILEPFLPKLVVVSPAEVPAMVSIESIGVLK
jgi:flagellar biosynthesis protein FlhA